MKKISIFLFALLISCSLSAQIFNDWGIGSDLSTSKVIGTLNIGFENNGLAFEGQLIPSFTRNVLANNYTGLKIGYDINHVITPSVGYYFNIKSNDCKEANSQSVGYSIKLVLPLMENKSGIFLNCLYVEKNIQITIGTHAVID